MKTRTIHKPFSASLKAKLRNKTFKEAFEHYSNALSVGLLIRSTRIKSGLTQKEFALRMGVSQQVIPGLKKGRSIILLSTRFQKLRTLPKKN